LVGGASTVSASGCAGTGRGIERRSTGACSTTGSGAGAEGAGDRGARRGSAWPRGALSGSTDGVGSALAAAFAQGGVRGPSSSLAFFAVPTLTFVAPPAAFSP
jgi:hypothetical protein